MELRAYQLKIANKVLSDNKSKDLIQLPTGGGKTVIAGYICGKYLSENKKFCSKECKYIGKINKINKNCQVCTKEFETTPSRNSKFCSIKCRVIASSNEYKNKVNQAL